MISLKYGIPVPTMYDISDSVGVHVSTKGVSVLEDKIQFFFRQWRSSWVEFRCCSAFWKKAYAQRYVEHAPSEKQSDITKILASSKTLYNGP